MIGKESGNTKVFSSDKMKNNIAINVSPTSTTSNTCFASVLKWYTFQSFQIKLAHFLGIEWMKRYCWSSEVSK